MSRRLPALSGLVAKGNPHNGHRHNWQKTERRVTGVVFYLFVCLDHAQPEIRAYDMAVFNPAEFAGQQEFAARRN